MSSETNPSSPENTAGTATAPPPEQPPTAHSDPAQAFWQVLTHYDATKVSAHRALRNALGVVLPLVGGFLLQMPRGGLVMASGALNVSYSDGGDPYATRAKRMLASSILCALAVFAGAISGEHQVLAVVFASGWAFVAGLVVAIDGAAADLGVISLVTLLIYAAQPLTLRQAAISGLLALAGGLLQSLLSVALWPVQRYDPERRVLAIFYQELAERAQAPLNAMSAPMASVHNEQAQQTLLGLGGDPSEESVRYRSLLNQGERIRLSLLRLARLRLRMEREKKDYRGVEIADGYLKLAARILRNVRDSLERSDNNSQPPDAHLLEQLERQIIQLRAQESTSVSFLAAVAKDCIFQMEALSGQLRAGLDLARRNSIVAESDATYSPTQPTWQTVAAGWVDTLQANLNLQSPAFRHALRLATLVALGDLAGRLVSWRRTYWLPMTIVLVLKPEFTATFSRGLLRIAGTIVGLLLATGLFHLMPSSTSVEVVLIFVFVYLLRWVGPANYGIFGVMVSALIVLLLAINGVAPRDVIWARGINTVAGGTLTLVAYWLWPTWERTRVAQRMAQLLDAYREYLHIIVRFEPHDPATLAELDRFRRAARVARSNFLASADRLGAEPGSTALVMSQLSAVSASSHRLVHAFMSLDALFLEASGRLSSSPPLRNFADHVENTLRLLAASLRATRVPSRDFPDLREQYRLMVQAHGMGSDPTERGFDPIDIEADRVTNSLNTLAEQIRTWTRSPQFIAQHKMQLSSPRPGV